jgi:hypothetical protein
LFVEDSYKRLTEVVRSRYFRRDLRPNGYPDQIRLKRRFVEQLKLYQIVYHYTEKYEFTAKIFEFKVACSKKLLSNSSRGTDGADLF